MSGDRPLRRRQSRPIAKRDLTVRNLFDPEHLVGIRPTLSRPPFANGVFGTAADLGSHFGLGDTPAAHVLFEGHGHIPPQFGAVVKRNYPKMGCDGPKYFCDHRPTMGNNLKTLREERRWTQPETAEKFGISFSGYVKLERAERKLSHDRIVKAAEVFGVSEQEVTSPPATVPLIGYVGAGGEADFGDSQGPFGEAEAPPRHSPHTVAVEVRGDSMPGIAENGWYLYYDNVQRPLDESMVGGKAPLVVGLSNGRVLVKRVRPGSRPGYYHLISTGGDDPIIDARVTWAARVTWIKPRWD